MAYGLAIGADAELREVLQVREAGAGPAVIRQRGGDVLLELGAVGCQDLEAALVAFDQIAERPKDVV